MTIVRHVRQLLFADCTSRGNRDNASPPATREFLQSLSSRSEQGVPRPKQVGRGSVRDGAQESFGHLMVPTHPPIAPLLPASYDDIAVLAGLAKDPTVAPFLAIGAGDATIRFAAC
jgi:hypothetical protein